MHDIAIVYRQLPTIRPISSQLYTLPKIPMPVYIAFYRNLWYNNQQEQGQHFVAVFFYCPAVRGIFYLPKRNHK